MVCAIEKKEGETIETHWTKEHRKSMLDGKVFSLWTWLVIRNGKVYVLERMVSPPQRLNNGISWASRGSLFRFESLGVSKKKFWVESIAAFILEMGFPVSPGENIDAYINYVEFVPKWHIIMMDAQSLSLGCSRSVQKSILSGNHCKKYPRAVLPFTLWRPSRVSKP